MVLINLNFEEIVKNPVFHWKCFAGIAGIILALAGCITIWAAMGGATAPLGYESALLLLVTIANLIGYLLGLPFAFCMTATFLWAVGPLLMAEADAVRIANQIHATNDLRAALAGLVILFIGAFISFACAPSDDPDISLGVNIIALIVVAAFDVTAGVILADQHQVSQAAQVLITLFIFAACVIFGSTSLTYAAGILAALMVTNYILPVLPKTGNNTYNAGYVLAWIGAVITCAFVFFMIQIVANPDDKRSKSEGGEDGKVNRASKHEDP